jgi:hypothetical protein
MSETHTLPAGRSLRWLQLLAVLALTVLTGCAHTAPPLPPFQDGVVLETISSAITLSVKSPEGSIGGSGYLLYRRPDSFRLVMLTPFGTTALDSYAVGSRLTFLVPSRSVAYVGDADELPRRAGMEGWRLLRWVVDGDPLRIPAGPARLERNDPLLGTVSARYDADGLLAEKQTGEGDRAVYADYRVVDGIPFPARLTVNDRHGGEVRVEFDEPELNRPLAEDAFTPLLQGLTPLPLTEFKGK